MIVLDASAMIELLLGSSAGVRLRDRISRSHPRIHVPHLIDAEVAQVLRRMSLAAVISEPRAAQAIEDLRDAPLDRHGHVFLLPRAWQLRGNLTIYDSIYLALAEALGADLWTLDAGLASIGAKNGTKTWRI